jgi:DNA mismatch endonuclease (patch repair protein)
VTDIFPPEKRSEIMRRIRSRDTRPELRVKQLLDRLGVDYVYQARVLGWRVDFLVPARRLVIEYRSCFWHSCGCRFSRVPKSRREYWVPKLEGNRERDRRKGAELESAGYTVFVVRDCDFESKLEELARLLAGIAGGDEIEGSRPRPPSLGVARG